MTSRSRIGVQFTVTPEMIEAARVYAIECTDAVLANVYTAMRALELGTQPEPPVKPGRDPYANGGR